MGIFYAKKDANDYSKWAIIITLEWKELCIIEAGWMKSFHFRCIGTFGFWKKQNLELLLLDEVSESYYIEANYLPDINNGVHNMFICEEWEGVPVGYSISELLNTNHDKSVHKHAIRKNSTRGKQLSIAEKNCGAVSFDLTPTLKPSMKECVSVTNTFKGAIKNQNRRGSRL